MSLVLSMYVCRVPSSEKANDLGLSTRKQFPRLELVRESTQQIIPFGIKIDSLITLYIDSI